MAQEVTGGTQVAVINTEHTVVTYANAGSYVFAVDVSNMIAGDTLEVRTKVKMRSGETSTQVFLATHVDAQVTDIKLSDPIPAPFEVACSIKQTAGTGRSFKWSLYRL